MPTYALIPVKELQKAKSRLSPILRQKERKVFCLKMLEDIAKTVRQAKCIEKTFIVSKDEEALSLSLKLQAYPFKETSSGLNQALSEAIQHCIMQGATSILILPADIPLAKPDDINRISLLKKKSSVVISPSRNENGTNALLLKPPSVLPMFYGKNSFQLFIKEAQKRRLDVHVHRSKGFELDVDTIDDLAELLAAKEKSSQAYLFLEEINVWKRLENFGLKSYLA
ncbi:MAG: 2-phospho-L-lactate guanylyltransferase [Candidatus Bathyarchaeia archaeon]